MKKIKYIIGALFIGLGTFSCSDDYLERSPSQLLSQEEVNQEGEIRPEVLDGYLNGMYALTYTSYAGGTRRHEDFGQKGVDIYTDMLSGDLVLGGANFGWYSILANLSVMDDYTSQTQYIPFRYYYRVILAANTLIDNFDLNNLPTNPVARYSLGQALAMRGDSYFKLLNLYSPLDDLNKKSVPLRLTADANQEYGLAPGKEVLNQVIKDLETSVALLDGYQRRYKSSVNQSVAKNMLAYAYALAGKNEEAAKITKEIIDSGEFTILPKDEVAYNSETGKGSGFRDVNSDSWMWGVDLTPVMEIGLVSWWGQVDIYSYSYASAGDPKVINTELYQSINDNDARKNQFLGTPGKLTPSGKFYPEIRVKAAQNIISTDYVYMRVEEAYLLHAETAAKSGDENSARQALKAVVSKRAEDTSYIDSLVGSSLLEEIYKQTRIELWGEGKVYFMLKRNKQTITYPSNHLFLPGEVLHYNDSRLTFEIPIAEVQNNSQVD